MKLTCVCFSVELAPCQVPHVELESMGPHMDLVLRRTKFAAPDLWKVATKRPRQ
jgi:hypothetical protein